MRHLTTATAISLCTLSTPALADVTPAQVWEDFSAYLSAFGYTVEAQETASGGDLVLNNVTMNVPVPEEDGAVSVTMEQLSLLDNGDGTVTLEMPETTPITMSIDVEGEQVDMVIDYVHDGMQIVVSGDENELAYSYSAASIGMSLASLIVDGEVVPRDVARFSMAAAPVEGQSVTRFSEDLRVISQSGKFGDITYTMAGNDPEGDEGGLLAGQLSDVAFVGTTRLPTNIDMNDMPAAFQAGFGVDGSFSHNGGSMEFSVNEGDGTTSGQTSSGSGYLTVAMNDQFLRYSIGGTEATVGLIGPELPFPLSASLGESRFDVTMPVGAPGTMQEAKLGVTFADLVLTELLWSMFDPGAALPRDPATLVLDMTAMVTPFVSIFDEEAMMALGNEAPGELNAVTLEGLELSAAGGSLTGSGAFTFDNTDLESFDGLPRPEGKVDLQVSGANALIDGLIEMGLLEPGDAMGARMMLSMMTVPGEAPDSATSTLEINAQGQVLANGQRIR